MESRNWIGAVVAATLWLAVVWANAQCNELGEGEGELFSSCTAMKELGATLGWKYDTEAEVMRMGFRAKPDTKSGWVGWGINPVEAHMVGTRCLIAFRLANGTVAVHTYNITADNYATPPSPSPIDIPVSNVSALYSDADGHISIFATWRLFKSKSITNNSVHHVWQTGPSVDGVVPLQHAMNTANVNSKGTLDLKSGTSSVTTSSPNFLLKNRHGILNVVGWGMLLPLGLISARYIRVFEAADPAWFYLHVCFQTTGYAVGVAGWATGLKLGSYSSGIVYSLHRNIGIVVFVFATLQVFALLLRPTKENKYRKYWNVYHHMIGYATIVLGLYNIFRGFDMLRPHHVYKTAYVSFLAVLGGVALLLEIVTWVIFFRRDDKGYDV